MRAAAKARIALAFFLSSKVCGIDVDHRLFEELFDCAFDLDFVGLGVYAKDILIVLFGKQGRLLGENHGFDMVEGFFHQASLSERAARASLVTMTLSKASNCSVFTSAAR